MNLNNDDKGKRPMGSMIINKVSPRKKAKAESSNVMFVAVDHTYYFRGEQGYPATFGALKYKMQLNKSDDLHHPLTPGRCGAMVNLLIGCFSDLPKKNSAFGNAALNDAQPGFPNKGYGCDKLDPPLRWVDTLRSTYNHPAKHCFPESERMKVTIISSMLPYSSTYRNYLMNDIRKNFPHIHIDDNIQTKAFCVDVQQPPDLAETYIVMNPSGENWAELAFLAPTLYVNDLLEIGTDAESNCFLTFSNKEAYIKFSRILAYLGIDNTLNAHLLEISQENSEKEEMNSE
jgi:hypothetical protein